jgi:hypothetical protein
MVCDDVDVLVLSLWQARHEHDKLLFLDESDKLPNEFFDFCPLLDVRFGERSKEEVAVDSIRCVVSVCGGLRLGLVLGFRTGVRFVTRFSSSIVNAAPATRDLRTVTRGDKSVESNVETDVDSDGSELEDEMDVLISPLDASDTDQPKLVCVLVWQVVNERTAARFCGAFFVLHAPALRGRSRLHKSQSQVVLLVVELMHLSRL